jgi:mRNA interferase MazF
MKGDVVIVSFPFTDLAGAKRRPAVVVAEPAGHDSILCLITSTATRDPHAIALLSADFASGTLRHDSFIRPGRLFTADSALIAYRAGRLTSTKLQEVIEAIVQIIQT